MLKKVKRIKLGPRMYRRLMKCVLERDQWKCQKCGSLENLQVHHKIKRSQQGNDALENLVTLCSYCHMAEHGQLYFDHRSMLKPGKHRAHLGPSGSD
jgi:5-methylcytosine-specific restriction endonuclease McrA